jgi:hypothetical protein
LTAMPTSCNAKSSAFFDLLSTVPADDSIDSLALVTFSLLIPIFWFLTSNLFSSNSYHLGNIYEAKVLKRQINRVEGRDVMQYFIHYKGWKSRWNEWVDGTRLLKINEQNRLKQQALKTLAIKPPQDKKKSECLLFFFLFVFFCLWLSLNNSRVSLFRLKQRRLQKRVVPSDRPEWSK